MSHLYLHIPFCKQACHYCDFHFSTSLKNRKEVLSAMMKELSLRKNELHEKNLSTIYFGGGTPSQLSIDELNFIFDEIGKHFSFSNDAEITLEANPDDLSSTYLKNLKSTPINRLSIGIQSFRDEDLKLMNRAHTSKEAESVVLRAQDNEFENLTVDLIYGIPGLDENAWKKNLEKVNQLEVQHLSCYCLTVEPKTALAKFISSGKISPVDDVLATKHFQQLTKFANENNFDQYEISNFAKNNFIAKHNSSYWFGESYLGIGPSAHSFDGEVRRWNISNNAEYVKLISENKKTFQEEKLSEKEKYNEFVMTRLRTKWGISVADLKNKFACSFGDNDFLKHFLHESEKWILSNDLENNSEIFSLTEKGKLFADRIASDLFLV